MFPDRRHRAVPPWVYWLLCLVPLSLLVLEQRSLTGYIGSDFRIFHDAVTRFLADPRALYGSAGDVESAARSLQGYIYPPPGVLALLPFGLGSVERDFALFTWTSLLLGGTALFIGLRLLDRYAGAGAPAGLQALILLMALASGPVFACRAGQVDLLIMALCMAAIVLGISGRNAAAGALLALGAWIKIYPVLLFVPLFFSGKKRRSLAMGFAAAALAVPLAAALVVPWEPWREYFVQLLPQMSSRTIVNIYNQSLAAVQARWQVTPDLALGSFAAVEVSLGARLSIAVFGLGIIAAAALAVRSTADRPAAFISCLIAMACISFLAPLGWGHTYVYAIPLWCAVTLFAVRQRNWPQLSLALLAWGMMLISAHHRFAFAEEQSLLWHIIYSRYALATLLLIALGFARVWNPGRRGAVVGFETAGEPHAAELTKGP